MSDAPAASPLNYERSAVVGAVVLDRRKNSTTITINGRAPARWYGYGFLSIGGAFLATSLALKLVPSLPFTDISQAWFIGAIGGIYFMLVGANYVVGSMHVRHIEIDDQRLQFSFRQGNAISRLDWPKCSFVDMVNLRPSLAYFMMPNARRLQGILFSGDRVEFHFGTRAEIEFLQNTLAEAIGLSAVDWVETGFSGPKWYSRLKIRFDPFGLRVTQPAAALWALIALVIVAGPAAFFIVGWIRFASRPTWDLHDPTLLMGGFSATFGTLAIAGIIHQLKRTVILKLDAEALRLDEQSPLRPANTQWPTPHLVRFELRRRRFRYDISVVFVGDVPPVTLFEKLYPHDARDLFENLNYALLRARRPKR